MTQPFLPATIVAPLTQPQLIALMREGVGGLNRFHADSDLATDDALAKLEEALGGYAYHVGLDDARQEMAA